MGRPKGGKNRNFIIFNNKKFQLCYNEMVN